MPLIPLMGFLGQPPLDGKTSGNDSNEPVETRIPEDPKCTDCHADLIGNPIVHSPAKESCTDCHQVRMPEHPDKISKGLFLVEESPGLCYICHDNIKKDIDTMRVVHQAVKDSRQCMNCHSPHSTDAKKLLIAPKDQLCLSCHDKEIKSADGQTCTDIKQLLSTSKVIHPAINGGCTSCHKPHASGENYLLISAFPRERYVKANKENYAVCWECHDSDLFDLGKTTTATGFRNGDKNLHHLHLTGSRGRSCVICHDVHAANNKFVIVDKVAFGQWKFNMNFVPSDSGGSCLPGCHNLAAYKR